MIGPRPEPIELNLPHTDMDTLCLHDLFIHQAGLTPDRIALEDPHHHIQLTYRELDQITDQLAISLHDNYKVGPDVVCGILMERSASFVVSYLAILKAGGAYMPLELVYPKPLLENAIKATDCAVVLTLSQYQHRLVDAAAPTLVVDNADLKKEWMNKHNDQVYPKEGYTPRPNADHLAFVVMSSGTTGQPKGICQVHRSAGHSYLDRLKRYPYPSDGTMTKEGAGVFFVWECIRPLLGGATCVVIPDHVLFDPPSMTQFCFTHGVTRMLVTPSLLSLVLDSVSPTLLQERWQHMHTLWLCGEVVTVDLATSFTKLFPHTELWNLYSISECHDVSIGDLQRDLDVTQKYATCGTNIPGVHFYIVQYSDSTSDTTGDSMKLVEQLGDTGEVYVGGPVIARGYLKLPEKTKERFVPNPFDDSCQTLYRTGDLGRILPTTMELEIVGRCDFMVKIRGYSVVLGAIEEALAKHAKIASAVVLAVGREGSRDKKLVAYVVPLQWDDPPSAASVRNFLKDHVPNYAIPSTFCVISALPVNQNAAGKLSRKDLPDPATAPRLRAFSSDLNDTATTTIQRVAPQTDMERAVMKVWTDLLDLQESDISTTESFYDVGGHSLLATRMVSILKEQFPAASQNGNENLTIVNVVNHPTIQGVAALLENTSTDIPQDTTIDLQAEADQLDPSIYPFATRKASNLSRMRLEGGALLQPRVVFLTGATGWLGANLCAQLLLSNSDVKVVCLARASDDAAAKERVISTLQKYKLLDPLLEHLKLTHSQDTETSSDEKKSSDAADASTSTTTSLLDDHLIALAGDLAQPLLGLDAAQFKELALEVDAILHCGAHVNLVQPYSSLKASNVWGTQELLRLATTNGLVKTKVKPVHYISTNGIFPIHKEAYDTDTTSTDSIIVAQEDVDLATVGTQLKEGYAQTKWVAERMCTIAESRGLPVSIFRPGNMAGSSTLKGSQNESDLNYLLLQGMLELQCSPDQDCGDAWALDMTPVDYAAQAVAHLVVQAPSRAMGQRLHLQTPHKPVSLSQVTSWLIDIGHTLESVTKHEFQSRLTTACNQERAAGVSTSVLQQLESGFDAFDAYFQSSTWLHFGCDNLQQALQGSGIACPPMSPELLARWFPVKDN